MTIATTNSWLVPSDRLAWDQDDWHDHYADLGDHYAASVIWAADSSCQLAMTDLRRLLAHHGASLAELQEDLATGQHQGARVLPLAHAAQALAHLGY